MTFNRMVKAAIQPYFIASIFKEMEEDDPYSVVHFLQKIHTKAWNYGNSKQADYLEKIMDKSLSWSGGTNKQFIKHIANLKDQILTLPARIKPLHHMSVTVNRVVASLARDQRLKSLHTFIRAQHDEDPE